MTTSFPSQRKHRPIAGMAAAATFLGAAFFGTMQPGLAQAPKGGPAAAGGTQIPRSQAEFEKQLGITAAQKAKMEAVKKKYEPKAKALQAQMQAMQMKMKPLQTQMQTMGMQASKEMEAILTPAQRTKIQAIQAAQRQQQGGSGGGMMGGGPPR